jgi:uncharacterized protein (UPF0332 family)
MVQAPAEVELPEVVAPAAYFAMYHAAVAALLHAGVVVPEDDTETIDRFSRHFAAIVPDALDQSSRFERSRQRRLIADYEADESLTIDHARAARDDAVAFVAFCERVIDGT